VREDYSAVPLSAVAGAPECISDLLGLRRYRIREMIFHLFHQPETGRLPEVCQRSTLDETTRGLPLPKCHQVGKRRAAPDAGPIRFDVRAVIE
jgi:hypothetical protein